MTTIVRPAVASDAGLVLGFIRKLAEYEKLLHRVEARQEDIERDLFGPEPKVYCQIAEVDGAPAGFALWFYTYSTFRGRHGIWLEDLFVDPHLRGKGPFGMHLRSPHLRRVLILMLPVTIGLGLINVNAAVDNVVVS